MPSGSPTRVSAELDHPARSVNCDCACPAGALSGGVRSGLTFAAESSVHFPCVRLRPRDPAGPASRGRADADG